VGTLGEVHPKVAAAFDAEPPVTIFALDVRALTRAAVAVRPYREIPRFPSVTFDIAIVVDEAVTAERVEQALASAGGKLLESARVFDVYRGPGLAPGKKSMAFALSYRAPDRTLSAEEVNPLHERLVKKVLGAVEGELRV
jgi:phenylalanyl-tRNA synthetase beta chain